MIKRLVIGAIAVVLLIAVGVVLWKLVDTQTATKTVVTTNQTEAVAPQQSVDEMATATQAPKARYVTYSQADLASTSGTKILFFHASWCPQCRALDEDITKHISDDNGVTIFKVDYDSNQALRQKYGVTLQTTFVKIDENGNLIKKYVAYNTPTYADVKANVF